MKHPICIVFAILAVTNLLAAKELRIVRDIGEALYIGIHDYSWNNGSDVIVPSEGTLSTGLCLDEHNEARAANGMGPLYYNTNLESAANAHNSYMESSNCFSHQCDGEQDFGARITAAGYSWSGAAENIAQGYTDCKDVLDGWMNSPGHRANILGPYRDVGCSQTDCSSCGQGYYWTCDFASPSGGSPSTGNGNGSDDGNMGGNGNGSDDGNMGGNGNGSDDGNMDGNGNGSNDGTKQT